MPTGARQEYKRKKKHPEHRFYMQDNLMLQTSILSDAPGKHCTRPTAEKDRRRESNRSMACGYASDSVSEA
jgi:hypothetical protein